MTFAGVRFAAGAMEYCGVVPLSGCTVVRKVNWYEPLAGGLAIPAADENVIMSGPPPASAPEITILIVRAVGFVMIFSMLTTTLLCVRLTFATSIVPG